MTSDGGACHVVLKIDSALPLFCLFIFFLGSYHFSGTNVSLVALIAPDIDKFILWEQECDVPRWVYPAEDM